MEKYLFAASIGAMVPSFLLLAELQRKFARELPVHCNAVLDTEFLLQPSMIQPHLECMGPVGRKMYLDFYNFDLVAFPMIYSTFLFGALSRIWPRNSAVWILPLLSALADVLENVGMYFLLFKFPARFELIATAISVFTRVKWFTVAASMVLMVLGGFMHLSAN
uniref:Uncharacterized protein n=1 Tax=Globisporangium ultimum (strain ATCC 200006 / CBS 805.95 / DAOM BR144) TaxID=431595 RepID=K3WNW2_GLOUD